MFNETLCPPVEATLLWELGHLDLRSLMVLWLKAQILPVDNWRWCNQSYSCYHPWFLDQVFCLLGAQNHKTVIDLGSIFHSGGWCTILEEYYHQAGALSSAFKRPLVVLSDKLFLDGAVYRRISGSHNHDPTTTPTLLDELGPMRYYAGSLVIKSNPPWVFRWWCKLMPFRDEG